jgi:hypothetical protein
MRNHIFTGLIVLTVVVVGALWFSDTLRIPTEGPSLASGAESVKVHGVSPTTPTRVTKAKHRAINPLAPMRLWIGGDSLAGALGPSLGTMTANTGVVQPQYDSRVGSGLISGDIDWPEHAQQQMDLLKPEVVVFIIGTNDANVYDDSLAAEYAVKTEQMMRILAGSGREVYWVNAPVMRDEDLEANVLKVNEIQRETAAKVSGVTFIDSHTLFADETGAFQSSLPDATGKKVVMRAGDGIHFTGAGGDHLAKVIFDKIEQGWKVVEQAVPTQPKRVLVTKGSTQVAGGGSSSSGSSGSSGSGSSGSGSSSYHSGSNGSGSSSGSSNTIVTTPATTPAAPPPPPSTTATTHATTPTTAGTTPPST